MAVKLQILARVARLSSLAILAGGLAGLTSRRGTPKLLRSREGPWRFGRVASLVALTDSVASAAYMAQTTMRARVDTQRN